MTDRLDVYYEALSGDARAWETAGDELGDASAAAGRLTIAASAFSFAGGAVATAYEAVRALEERLATGGQTEVLSAGRALRQARQDYEACEGDAGAALRDLWEPV
ncbi:MAG: hypothetical protein HGA44_06135 [Cellulomonadaceae bacterium]|nr:hypothetical protein [Cellulomonadaceae bacterium]